MFTSLLVALFSDDFYHVMRTQQNLAYNLYMTKFILKEATGLKMYVQGKVNPYYVETRIEAFLETLPARIDKMSDEELDKVIEAYRASLLTPFANLQQEANYVWDRILDQSQNFDRCIFSFFT